MSADRYIVTRKFTPLLGWVSEIADTQSERRILVAGVDNDRRARERADSLNREAVRVTP